MQIAAQVTVENDLGFWRAVYQEHGPAILAFLRGRSGSRDDAEELLQETFLQAIRARDRIRNRGAVRSYLFTTAHNLLRNRQRRMRISPLVDGVEADGEGPSTEAADTRAHLRALLERLDVALDALSEDHRQAFQMAVLDQMPYRVIAEQTGWSLAAVKVNVYRARRQVTSDLADLLPGGSGGNHEHHASA